MKGGQPTKKEKRYNKLKQKFDNGKISSKELNSIPVEKRLEYLSKMISRKYNCSEIEIECEICAKIVLFKDSGYISDEDLLEIENISKQFKPI